MEKSSTRTTGSVEHPRNPHAVEGVPGFHQTMDAMGAPLAAMELDADAARDRANTGTGDQPGNAHDRFATPNQPLPESGAADGSTEGNKFIVRSFVREVLEQGRMDAVDKLVAPGFRSHTWRSAAPGAEGLKAAMVRMAQSVTEVRMTVEDVIAEGDRVAIRLSSEANHTGEFMGMPASNRRYAISEIHIFRLEEGRIIEHWHNADMLGLMQQIGALPPPATVQA